MFKSDSSDSLAPRRWASLQQKHRPTNLDDTDSETERIPRRRGPRLSRFHTTSHDLLKVQPFDQEKEQKNTPVFIPTMFDLFPDHICNQPLLEPPTTNNNERRPSFLKQSMSELRSIGRRMSNTVKSKGTKQKDETTLPARPDLFSFRFDGKLLSFSEAVAYRPNPRGWMTKHPGLRRTPSLPLDYRLDRASVLDPEVELARTRSRGQPVLSNLVFGGVGARASAAAQNELYHASRATPLPPYQPIYHKVIDDSESGIGFSLESLSRRQSTSSIQCLPLIDPADILATEILENVFSFLDAQSLVRAAAVSHKWRDASLSQLMWRQVFYQEYGGRKQFPHNPTPGLGKGHLNQDFRKLYKIRKLIDRRWENREAAAIYLNGHKDSVYCVQFDEHKIITGSRDNTIRVWDAHTYQCIRKLGPSNNPRERQQLERTPVEPRGIVPFFKTDITSLDPISPDLPHCHQASVLCLQFDSEILVTGSSDFTSLVWSIKDNYKPIFRLVGHTAGVLDVSIDEKHIVTCSKDATIKVWSRTTGKLLKTLTGHRGPVNAVQIRGNLLASASGDGTARLWRLEDGQCVKVFPSKDRGLACVEFSEDGRTIFAGGNDKVVYEYDTVTGNRVRELQGHGDLVRSLHLDSSNSRIVSGSYDHSIKVWDAKKGQNKHDGGLLIDFAGWTSSWMLAAKSDYRKIVCTSQDGRVVVIDFGFGIDDVTMVETEA